MDAFEPDFEIIKMDAEVASYQEDFDPERKEGGAATDGSEADDRKARP